jgi:hypothetical protein
VVNGTLRACGMSALTTGGGGGSGGAILLAGKRLTVGASAHLLARGGNAITHGSSPDPDKWYTAGGGGGRIALWRQVSASARDLLIAGQAAAGVETDAAPFVCVDDQISVLGGEGYQDGEAGTVRFVDGRPRGSVLMLR